MKFGKVFLAVLLALVIWSVVGFFLFFGVVGALVGSVSSGEEVDVKSGSVLQLSLNRAIAERAEENPFEDIEFLDQNTPMSLMDIKASIQHAKEDENIKGIFLRPGLGMGGFGTLEEIRNDLIDFKTSGKFIIAYDELISETGYYVASVADEIHLNKIGNLEFNGLASEVTFIQGTLEMLGVEPYIFKVGEFKSAIEPLIRKNMSEASRKQVESYMNSIYDHYLAQVAAARGTDVATLRNISKNMLAYNSATALEHGLITHASYYDEAITALKAAAGLEADNKLPIIPIKKYRKSFSTYTSSANRIAVIVGQGSIMPGKGDGTSTIGSDTFVKAIRKARKDKRTKAIVLRVNSPGGSVIASDMIWHEIELAKEQGIPVVASMGSVAASGGYYISMGADTIVAQPNTITGSIGIFSILFNAEKFLENKLGVTTDIVQTGEYSDLYNMTRPLSEQEKALMQRSTNEGYRTFISKAAQGRGVPEADIEAVASGRVWSGQEALENGLVDVLGGIDDAIDIAASMADLDDDYRLRYYPKLESPFEDLFGTASDEMESRVMEKQLGPFAPYIKQMQQIQQYQGVQARLPYDIVIH